MDFFGCLNVDDSGAYFFDQIGKIGEVICVCSYVICGVLCVGWCQCVFSCYSSGNV